MDQRDYRKLLVVTSVLLVGQGSALTPSPRFQWKASLSPSKDVGFSRETTAMPESVKMDLDDFSRRAAEDYPAWLQNLFRGIVRWRSDDPLRPGTGGALMFLGILEVLRFGDVHKDDHGDEGSYAGHTFPITGGLLTRRGALDPCGTLRFSCSRSPGSAGFEFKTELLDFPPSLVLPRAPRVCRAFVYSSTQVKVHTWVMQRYHNYRLRQL